MGTAPPPTARPARPSPAIEIGGHAAARPQAATNVLFGQRATLYTGPAIEDMTLSAGEKAALIAALPAPG